MSVLPARAWTVLRELPWADASHAAIVSAAPAILAVLYGDPRLGWSAIAAFWACFADPGGPLAQRLRAMGWVAVLGALFCFLGSGARHELWLLLPLTFICCTAASLAQVGGPSASIIGTLVSAGFVVSTELPAPTLLASAAYAAFFVGGGIWAIVMTALVWRRRPWRYAAAAVAQCFDDLGAYAAALSSTSLQVRLEASTVHRSALRAQIETARRRVREVLTSRPSRLSRGQQLMSLLDAAERAFVTLVALGDTMASLAGQRAEASSEANTRLAPLTVIRRAKGDASVLRVVRRFAYACSATSRLSNLSDPHQRLQLEHALARTDRAVRRAHAYAQSGDVTAATVLPLLDRLFGAGSDAISALLNGAADKGQKPPKPQPARAGTASANTGPTPAATISPEAPTPHPIRARYTHLRNSLHLRSSIARHAIRVGVAATVSVALCKTLHIDHGFWMSLTVVFILQPYLAATWERTAERIVGSVAGAIGASLVGILLPSPLAVAIAVLPIALGTFVGRTIHYALFTFFVTLQFVLVAEIQQPADHEFVLAALRAMNSVFGGILALVIGMLLWPERASDRLAAVLSEAVERHAHYLRMVLQSSRSGEASPASLTTLRREACLSADNAQVVLHGLMRSPLHQHRSAAAIADLIAALRGLTAAATVLELQPLAPVGGLGDADRHHVATETIDTIDAVKAAEEIDRYARQFDVALTEVAKRIRVDLANGKHGVAAINAHADDHSSDCPSEPPAAVMRPADPRSLALQRIAALGQLICRFPDRLSIATPP